MVIDFVLKGERMKKFFLVAAALVGMTGFAGNRGATFAVDSVFGDHMVLQADKPLRFSGYSPYDSEVEVEFDGVRERTRADSDGRWTVEFPARPAGGPYTVIFRPVNFGWDSWIELKDVMVGEVWFIAGQGNVDMPMWSQNDSCRWPDGDRIAAEFRDDGLRFLSVPHAYSMDGPMSDLPGRTGWKTANSAAVLEKASALGFWFGKKLREARKQGVAVGIITAGWSGSRIEPWIPRSGWAAVGDEAALKAIDDNSLPKARVDAASRKASEEAERARTVKKLDEWVARFEASAPEKTAAAKAAWSAKEIDETGWTRTTEPRQFGEPGVDWFRFTVEIPAECDGHAAVCELGYVNDCDETWFDGEKIGETGVDTPFYWSARRSYPIKRLKAGEASVAIRAKSHYLSGMLSKKLAIVDGVNGKRLEFGEGEFLERVEFKADVAALGERPSVSWGMTFVDPRENSDAPAVIYNAMVSPLTAMNVRGVQWYHGIAHAGEPEAYARWQKLLVSALRKAWRDENLPFVITQLPAFLEHHLYYEQLPADTWRKFDDPADADYLVDFRLMQDRVAREIPRAGLVSSIDVGELSNVFPTNCDRLAVRMLHEANRLSGADAKALPSPRAVAAKRAGDAVIVSFAETGAGLALDGGAKKFHPHLWALAGADGKFAWADGKFEADGTVKVTSAAVKNPAKVRYACSAFPPGVAFRRRDDGLPVLPFELEVKPAAAGASASKTK